MPPYNCLFSLPRCDLYVTLLIVFPNLLWLTPPLTLLLFFSSGSFDLPGFCFRKSTKLRSPVVCRTILWSVFPGGNLDLHNSTQLLPLTRGLNLRVCFWLSIVGQPFFHLLPLVFVDNVAFFIVWEDLLCHLGRRIVLGTC